MANESDRRGSGGDKAAERAQDELRAAALVLTATYQCGAGQLDREAYCALVASVAVEHFPEHPVELALPVAWLALRALTIGAEAAGVTVPEMLAQLGGEVAGPPPAG